MLRVSFQNISLLQSDLTLHTNAESKFRCRHDALHIQSLQDIGGCTICAACLGYIVVMLNSTLGIFIDFHSLVLFVKLTPPNLRLNDLLLKVSITAPAVCVMPAGEIQPDLNMSSGCTVPCPACHRYCTGQTARQLQRNRQTKRQTDTYEIYRAKLSHFVSCPLRPFTGSKSVFYRA